MDKLPHKILPNPFTVDMGITITDPPKIYLEANDNLFRIDRSSRGFNSFYPGIFVVILSLFFFIGVYIGTSKDESGLIVLTTIATVLAVLGLFIILYGFIAPKKEIVLNRMQGLITVPRFMWTNPITFPFVEGEGLKVFYNRSEGVFATQLSIRHKVNKRMSGRLSDFMIEEFWSFFVWYMDKNRPLPPGTAFDPYRQQDFERRKAERFPNPLYPSSIPTPEATPEQQREREKYWTDFESVKRQIRKKI